jgi:hypothetical protein
MIQPPADALVSRRALDRILVIARAVPDLGDCIGFECRLGSAAGPVDLGLGIGRRTGGGEQLPTLPPGFPPEWQRFAAFCRTWWDPTSLLHAWIPFAFLEFDADAPGTYPVPSVFVSLDWPLANPDDPRSEADRRRLSATVVRNALALLLESSADGRLAQNLDRCIDDLPDEGRVVHAGAMLGRSACGARLSIAVPRHAQGGYLAGLGLPQLGDLIESIVASLACEDGAVHLEVDVAEKIGPRVGVVLARDDTAGWARLLERVADCGLCTAVEKAALLAWPQLSHVKVTPGTGGRLEAKAYLLLPSAA